MELVHDRCLNIAERGVKAPKINQIEVAIKLK
jgi:hypothetical protein